MVLMIVSGRSGSGEIRRSASAGRYGLLLRG